MATIDRKDTRPDYLGEYDLDEANEDSVRNGLLDEVEVTFGHRNRVKLVFRDKDEDVAFSVRVHEGALERLVEEWLKHRARERNIKAG